MDQKLFIKITHHAYAPEYLSSYAYENISQKESNAVTNRASGCYLEVPGGRRCRVAKSRVARDHPPCAKPIGRESVGWVRERKPKCRAENVSLMLLASSRYFCELPFLRESSSSVTPNKYTPAFKLQRASERESFRCTLLLFAISDKNK